MPDKSPESTSTRRGFRLASYGLTALVIVGILMFALLNTPETERSPASPSDALSGEATPIPLAETNYPVPPDSLFVSPKGDDKAAGTKESPLHTIKAAVQKAKPGNTITVRAGTYRETVGSVGKKLTIQPYPDEKVWVKGSVVISDWAPDGTAWRHSGWSPALCRTCFIPGIIDPAHPLAGLPDMVFINNAPRQQVATRDEVGPGKFFVDVPGKALIIGDNPDTKTVEATTFDRFLQFEKAAAGSILRGIGVSQYGSNQNYGVRGAMVVVDAADVVIENNTFAWSASTGLAVYQPRVSVIGSTMLNNGLAGLTANRADKLQLERNTFSRNNIERFSLGGESIGSAGAKITRSRDLFVADNVFAGNLASGWWCDLGCINATVIRNISKNNTVNGIYYEVSSQALIASNLVVNNGQRGLKISSSDRVQVYNNTFSANKISLGIYNDKREPSFDQFSVENKLSWLTAGTELINNYFSQPGNTRIIEVADYKNQTASNPPLVSRSDANAYLSDLANRSEPLLSWSAGQGKISNFATVEEFHKDTSQEEHGIAVPSQTIPFIDPTSGNFELKPDAPGVGSGLPLPEPISKLLGPVTKPNIGVLFGPQK